MVEEERNRLVDLGVLERVVVVDNQDERPFECVELVDQRRQDVLYDGCARRLEERQRLTSYLGPNGADGLDEMHPEPDWIVVPTVDGEPCKRASLSFRPLPRREKRRLSRSCRRREERQLVAASHKLLHESGASNEVTSHGRRLKLPPQDSALRARCSARPAPPRRAVCRYGIHRPPSRHSRGYRARGLRYEGASRASLGNARARRGLSNGRGGGVRAG